MRCEHAEPLIGPWQDGELDRWTSWRVAQHVRRCPTCAAEAESLIRLSNTLRHAAPLGAIEQVPPSPHRNSVAGPLAALTLASAVVAAFLVMTRPPATSLVIPERQIASKHVEIPHPVSTPEAPGDPVRTTALPDAPRPRRNKPAVRHIVAQKQLVHRLRAMRVERKPSLLPPLTRPEWEGSSIRYVATLTEEERQPEIVSIESELPPVDELKRLVEEKSEFIFVQASLPILATR